MHRVCILIVSLIWKPSQESGWRWILWALYVTSTDYITCHNYVLVTSTLLVLTCYCVPVMLTVNFYCIFILFPTLELVHTLLELVHRLLNLSKHIFTSYLGFYMVCCSWNITQGMSTHPATHLHIHVTYMALVHQTTWLTYHSYTPSTIQQEYAQIVILLWSRVIVLATTTTSK